MLAKSSKNLSSEKWGEQKVTKNRGNICKKIAWSNMISISANKGLFNKTIGYVVIL